MARRRQGCGLRPDPSHAAPALEVRSAGKRFGRVEALAGLSLVLGRREWVGLLGPNGAGKSTLMAAIAGLLPLDSGSIDLFGRRADRRSASRLIGLVPQEIALYPLLTTVENLRVFGRLNGVVARELGERVDWALEWTGLERRADTPAGELSGGMQRRLNIACGVLHRPSLVLLDEPTVGVDPQGRRRIWRMLEELRTDGASLVQSTHELHEIETLCDRMLIMDHGRVLAQGTVTELVERTLGDRASLRLTLDRPAAGLLSSNGLLVSGATVSGALADVADELPAVLARIRDAGLDVRDVQVTRPNLAAVFSHLTGRELRE